MQDMRPWPILITATASIVVLWVIAMTFRSNEQVILWSKLAPVKGERVHIKPGQIVMLDVPAISVSTLDIEGELRIPDGNFGIEAEKILVAGKLVAGTASNPHRGKLDIRLDARNAKSDPDSGLMLVTGLLSLHGDFHGPAWARLSESAPQSSKELILDQVVNWNPGDQIVVAATGFDPSQSEALGVAHAGAKIRLTGETAYSHFGQITEGVDERAEVANLTRNILIRSRFSNDAPQFGGSVMITAGGRAQLDSVELAGMGRLGVKGMYPLHFHLVGDASKSYVRRVSIHNSFNRCLTVHGTSRLEVTDLVAYRSIGHLIFLEDGVETDNLFERCLALNALNADPETKVLTSDLAASGFWITHPTNRFRNCVAAACEGQGYWFAIPQAPTGMFVGSILRPRNAPLGEFRNCVSHSNLHNGLFVDGEPNPPGVYTTPNYDPSQPATFDGLVAYKNSKRGAWLRGSRLTVTRAKFADQPIGATLAANKSTITHSLFVGSTSNGGELAKPGAPTFPIRGFEFYDGPVGLENITFKNYQPTMRRQAGAISFLRFSPFFIHPQNWTSGLTFENAQPVYVDHVPSIKSGVGSADGYRTALFVDRDGSLTGIKGASVCAPNPMFFDAKTSLREDWNAAVSTHTFGHLWVEIAKAPLTKIGQVRISNVKSPACFHAMAGSPEEGKAALFQANIPSGEQFWLSLNPEMLDGLRVSVQFLEMGKTVEFVLPASSDRFIARSDTMRQLGGVLDSQSFFERDGRMHLILRASGSGVASARLQKQEIISEL